jgi:hypothetical protein
MKPSEPPLYSVTNVHTVIARCLPFLEERISSARMARSFSYLVRGRKGVGREERNTDDGGKGELLVVLACKGNLPVHQVSDIVSQVHVRR